MYPPGHVGLTAVLFAPLVYWLRVTGRERTAAECLAAALALSLLPDVDALLPGVVHRGVTHTPLAAVVSGLFLAAFLRRETPSAPGLAGEHPALCWVVGTAAVLSHLLGDVITPMGIQLLFPAAGTMYTLDVVRASSPAANTLLLVTGTAVLTVTYSVPVRLPTPETDDGVTEESRLSLSPSSRR